MLLAILAPLSPDTAPNETQELAGEKSKDRGRRTTTRSQLPAALIFAAIVIVLGIYFRLFTPPLFGVLLVLYVLGQKVQVLPLRIGLVFIRISLLRSRRSYNARSRGAGRACPFVVLGASGRGALSLRTSHLERTGRKARPTRSRVSQTRRTP